MNTLNNFVFCNPHPQGKMVADCVKRAIVVASEINYHDVAIMLNRYRATTGSKKFNNRDNWKDFVVNVLGGNDNGNMQYANCGQRFQVIDYARHVHGKAIVQCSHHIVACKKGNFYDTWNSGEKSIYKAWGIPSYECIVERIKTKYSKLCKGLTLAKWTFDPSKHNQPKYKEIEHPKDGIEYWVVLDENTEIPHYFLTKPEAQAFANENGHEIVFHECFN